MFRLSLYTFCLFYAFSTTAQQDANTASVGSALATLRANYYKEKRAESFLAIGSEYAEYNPVEDEHPFFESNDWVMGSVKYNDVIYHNVPLQYDIRFQKLLTEHPASGKKIELVQQHVDWFDLEQHHFEYLNETGSAGYYELLANGTAKLWASYSKMFQESTTTGKLTVRTEEDTKYFIEKEGTLSPVRSKGSVLASLDDKRAVLQQELKKQRINFNRNRPAGLIEAVRLYNSIH